MSFNIFGKKVQNLNHVVVENKIGSAMTQKDGGQFFLQTVKGAALSAGRHITHLRTSGAASCHTQCPASFPAGSYLTASLFYISPS